eukprot:408472-Pleurochrysis_carterae.AAC.1
MRALVRFRPPPLVPVPPRKVSLLRVRAPSIHAILLGCMPGHACLEQAASARPPLAPCLNTQQAE